MLSFLCFKNLHFSISCPSPFVRLCFLTSTLRIIIKKTFINRLPGQFRAFRFLKFSSLDRRGGERSLARSLTLTFSRSLSPFPLSLYLSPPTLSSDARLRPHARPDDRRLLRPARPGRRRRLQVVPRLLRHRPRLPRRRDRQAGRPRPRGLEADAPAAREAAGVGAQAGDCVVRRPRERQWGPLREALRRHRPREGLRGRRLGRRGAGRHGPRGGGLSSPSRPGGGWRS